jgi:acyl-coenzyme A synthetase/AMP-(fatty) acid ligase
VNPLARFWQHVETSPDRLALVSDSVQLTYRNLGDNVSRFAAALRKRGVKPGNIVAIQLDPELEAVLILATTQLGATSLSYSKIIDDEYGQHIDFVISQNNILLSKAKARLLIDPDFMRELGTVGRVLNPEAFGPAGLVRLSFSSGTTGVPKGIPFTASRLELRLESAQKNWLQKNPRMSLLGLDTITGILSLFSAMASGNTFFVSRNAQENLKVISKHKIQSIDTSPARLQDLLYAFDSETKTTLRQILVAGSLLSTKAEEACLEKLGIHPTYLYGSTEVGAVSVGQFVSEKSNCVGSITNDVTIEIVNDDLEPVKSGETGNIRYRKEGMPDEYWFSSSSPLNGFVDDWFYPGDRGWIDNSNRLFLEGRADDLVNVGGNKFNLLTLDQWLAKTNLFSEVASFQFIRSGETKIGIAFSSHEAPNPEALQKELKEFLPGFQADVLLRISSLPRNKMDKVDRIAIATLAEGSND